MVMPWTDEDRRELAELCRVHDRMMAEHAASQRVRTRRSDAEDELVFKVMEDATPPVHELEQELFTEAQRDVLSHMLAFEQDYQCEERAREMAPLKAEIADLKGKLDAVAELKEKLDAVLTLLGQKEFKSAEVIDLPDWRQRGVA